MDSGVLGFVWPDATLPSMLVDVLDYRLRLQIFEFEGLPLGRNPSPGSFVTDDAATSTATASLLGGYHHGDGLVELGSKPQWLVGPESGSVWRRQPHGVFRNLYR